MNCPTCGFVLDEGYDDCPRCGVIVADVLRARDERMARAVALPLALLAAWLAVKASPGMVRLLAMWVHESGHAVTAWVCGYTAWPGPWFTPVSTHRSPSLTVLLVGLLGYGGYRAWQYERWFWTAASTCAMALVLAASLLLNPISAQELIIFGGDGGCFVLGTMLMCTMYARKDHPVRRQHLRWALVIIGALAFMDAYAVWSGPTSGLPFGETENGPSDPTVLTGIYGWTVLSLVRRYLQLGHACMAILAVVYVVAFFIDTGPPARAASPIASLPE